MLLELKEALLERKSILAKKFIEQLPLLSEELKDRNDVEAYAKMVNHFSRLEEINNFLQSVNRKLEQQKEKEVMIFKIINELDSLIEPLTPVSKEALSTKAQYLKEWVLEMSGNISE